MTITTSIGLLCLLFQVMIIYCFFAKNGAECNDNNVDGTRAKYDNSLIDSAMPPDLQMPTKSELRH